MACAACSRVQSGAANTRSLVRWLPATSRSGSRPLPMASRTSRSVRMPTPEVSGSSTTAAPTLRPAMALAASRSVWAGPMLSTSVVIPSRTCTRAACHAGRVAVDRPAAGSAWEDGPMTAQTGVLTPVAGARAGRLGLFAESRADLGLAFTVIAWVGVVLPLDNAGTGREWLLGAVTWGLLLVLLRRESAATRAQLAVVVAFATLIEYA